MDVPPSNKPTLLERLSALMSREPEDREQLVKLLHGAYENSLLDADALSMMEGVLQVSERQVREIMIPRAQLDVVDINEPTEKLLPYVIETAHSRFPAVDGSFYYVGRAGINYQQRDGVILAPIRLGVGMRAGASIGYMHYTREKTYLPF